MRRRVLGQQLRTTPNETIVDIILQLLPSFDGYIGLCHAAPCKLVPLSQARMLESDHIFSLVLRQAYGKFIQSDHSPL